jgi:uncharacterized protein YuzE
MINYDPEVDAAYIQLTNSQGVESEEIADGIIVDYDKDDNVVGIELLGVKTIINEIKHQVNVTQSKVEAMELLVHSVPDMAERLGESKNWWIISMVANLIFSLVLFLYCLAR